jgi:hypothetical protein
MSDRRKNNSGTLGNKGGRPPKSDEIALIERLSPMDDIALEALRIGVESRDYNFVKLFMEYRFGKPNMKIEHSGEVGIMWNETKTYDTDEK